MILIEFIRRILFLGILFWTLHASIAFAETYIWDDYTKSYTNKIEVRNFQPNSIEIELPESIIHDYTYIPLYVDHDIESYELTKPYIKVNKSFFATYPIRGSKLIRIKTKHLSVGSNKFTFGLGTSTVDKKYITEIKIDLSAYKVFETKINTNLRELIEWRDFTVPLNRKMDFESPKTVIVYLPAHIIESNDSIDISLEGVSTLNGTHDAYLLINGNENAKFRFGARGKRGQTKTFTIKTRYLKVGKNELYFYSRSLWPYQSRISSISFNLDKSEYPMATKTLDKNLKVAEINWEIFQNTGKSNLNDIAVIISNQNYNSKDIPRVDYTFNDAIAIEKFLKDGLGYKEDNIIFEKDSTKTRLEMIFGTENNHRGELHHYIKPKKSRVFIYYSGHGSPDPQTKKAYLLPSDCNLSMVDLTSYPLDVLYGNLPKLKAKSITVVIDACFSGETDTGRWLVKSDSPALIKVANPLLLQSNVTIFTSAENDQINSWFPQKAHSLFTYFFLAAVTGNADFNQDNQITYQEIYDFVADNAEGVPYYAKKLHGGRIQNPTLQTSNENTVFVKY